jgi:hypothetical protein
MDIYARSKCNCDTERYICSSCKIAVVCLKCSVTLDGMVYCLACTGRCLYCKVLKPNRELKANLCNVCFCRAANELCKHLSEDDPYKNELPEATENVRLRLSKPVIVTGLIKVFLEEVSWSVVCDY